MIAADPEMAVDAICFVLSVASAARLAEVVRVIDDELERVSIHSQSHKALTRVRAALASGAAGDGWRRSAEAALARQAGSSESAEEWADRLAPEFFADLDSAPPSPERGRAGHGE